LSSSKLNFLAGRRSLTEPQCFYPQGNFEVLLSSRLASSSKHKAGFHPAQHSGNACRRCLDLPLSAAPPSKHQGEVALVPLDVYTAGYEVSCSVVWPPEVFSSRLSLQRCICNGHEPEKMGSLSRA